MKKNMEATIFMVSSLVKLVCSEDSARICQTCRELLAEHSSEDIMEMDDNKIYKRYMEVGIWDSQMK